MRAAAAWFFVALISFGCASDYSWRSQVPQNMRTVSVPVFRNESEVTELGGVVSRQLLREFQREGTFSIAAPGNSALEIQGVIKRSSAGTLGYNRGTGMRFSNFDLALEAEVSVIDKVTVNNCFICDRAICFKRTVNILFRQNSFFNFAVNIFKTFLECFLNISFEHW